MVFEYFLIFGIILLSLLFFGSFFEAPWAPTRKKDFERIAKIVGLKEGMLFYDLGSGTGEMLFYLSRKYKINCIGIEISPVLYLYSKIKSLFYKNVKIMYGSFYAYNLSKADVVYFFLIPRVLTKVKEKVIKKLPEDTKIIVSCWPIQNCNPIQVSKIDNGVPYYLYNKKSIL